MFSATCNYSWILAICQLLPVDLGTYLTILCNNFSIAFFCHEKSVIIFSFPIFVQFQPSTVTKHHFKYVKNFTIACTWILTMHLWQNRDASWVDVFLILFITCVSIRYDKTESILKKALIDSLIILPFLANFFAEKYWIENSLKP